MSKVSRVSLKPAQLSSAGKITPKPFSHSASAESKIPCFSQNKIYDNASSQVAYQNKLGNLLGSYSDKLNKITNMLNNVSPVNVSDSLLAVKFNINDYGKNINAYNEKVIQIYGINDSLLYETNQGAVPQRSFLTPPEEQTKNKKNYNSKIAYYNEKIQQINNIINN
jgi:hypothetical protein